MERRGFMFATFALIASTALTSCYAPGPGHGPPPHAPAHGRRRRHASGVELVFDPDIGVYVVVGYPYYFHDDLFYWYRDGRWLVSVDPRGDWRSARALPPGLQKKGRGGPPGRGRGRGRERGYGY